LKGEKNYFQPVKEIVYPAFRPGTNGGTYQGEKEGESLPQSLKREKKGFWWLTGVTGRLDGGREESWGTPTIIR